MTKDLEKTPDQNVSLKESDLMVIPDRILRKSRVRIEITEEPLIPEETVFTHHDSANGKVIPLRQIPATPVISNNDTVQKSGTPDILSEQSFVDEIIPEIVSENQTPASIETGEISVPVKAETGLLKQELQSMDSGKTNQELPEIKTEPFARMIRPCTPDRFEARRVIEALRLGVVPHKKIEDFSCGRETESEIVEEWLEDPEKSCMFFSGEYGSGKSHMLEISAAKALKNNWAVAVIEIDPDESPFNQPKKIYRQIIKSFVYQDEENLLGFREFILKILNSGKKKKIETLREHPFIGSLFRAWHEISDDTTYLNHEKTDLLLWVEGDEINPPGLPKLYGYQNSANIYCNLLSGLGWAARNIAGLNGILILVDEGEGIDKGWYSTYQFSRAGSFIKGLVLMANSEKILHDEFNYMKTVAFPRGIKEGEYTRLIYGGRRPCSFLWSERSHVKILFSFTPYIVPFVYEDIIGDEAVCRKIPEITLEELREEDLDLLYHKINSLYDTAYEFSSQNSIFPILPKEKTRLFVKSVVEALDIMRFNPGTYHEELGIENSVQPALTEE
jgi:hypothetical protein